MTITRAIYKTIAIAGTFDRLHQGHRFFISEAFKYGRKVIIGLTSDNYVKEKLKASFDSTQGRQSSKFRVNVNTYTDRKRELEDYLREKGLLERAKIVKIDDVYGPAVENNRIEAIVVTPETVGGAQKVNTRRQELGLNLLKIITVPLIMADDRKRIASTRIRRGEIDRWGGAFAKQMLISNFKFQISNELRNELKKPLGVFIKGEQNNHKFVAVKLKQIIGKGKYTLISTIGDEVTKLCNEVGITINLAVVDYTVKRQKKYNSLTDLGFGQRKADFSVENPAGNITKELVGAVEKAYLHLFDGRESQIIKVSGEEDLAGVPAILLAPLGALILYGQPAFVPTESGLPPALKLRRTSRRGKPDSGVVVVKVTENVKQRLIDLIKDNI